MKNQSLSTEYQAYIPCYHGGNSVAAVKEDGSTVIINKSIKSLVKKLLQEHNLDMRAIRKNYSAFIGRSNIIPIPLSLDKVLVPIKVRKTIAPGDGSFGYIVLSSMEKIHGQHLAVVRLKSGFEVESLETVRTVKKRFSQGSLIRDRYETAVFGQYSLKEAISRVGSEYGKPATKGDITMLAYEIMKLRKYFEK